MNRKVVGKTSAPFRIRPKVDTELETPRLTIPSLFHRVKLNTIRDDLQKKKKKMISLAQRLMKNQNLKLLFRIK